MASLITVRLYNDDLTPKTGDTPTLSAIQQDTKEVVLDWVAMEEVGAWFYQYEFGQYNSSKLYFFYIDWEVYDDINTLDSYGNKWTRGKRQELIIDPYAISEAVWDTKTKDHTKKWTFGEIIQKEISFSEIIISINTIKDKVEETIKWIKLPKEIKKDDIIDWVNDIMDEKLSKVASNVNLLVNKEDKTGEVVESIAEVKNMLNLLSEIQNNITNLNENVEWISKQDLVEKIDTLNIEWSINKVNEINSKMLWLVWKEIRDQIIDLRWSINNLYIRLWLVWPMKK